MTAWKIIMFLNYQIEKFSVEWCLFRTFLKKVFASEELCYICHISEGDMNVQYQLFWHRFGEDEMQRVCILYLLLQRRYLVLHGGL